jgi:hypothetical protein
MVMQLALRPYATAGIAVVGASLIHVTPVAAPNIEQRAVNLAATEALSDLVGPIDAVVSSLGGLSGELSGVLPIAGDLSGTFADGASSLALDSTDFWQQLWQQFYDAVIPIIGPIILVGGIFLGISVAAVETIFAQISEFFQTIYEDILTALGLEPASALTAAATEALDPSLLTSGLTEALDPSLLTSGLTEALDPSAIAGLGTVFDPAGIADVGTLMSTSLIPDIDGILMSLIP